MFYRFLKITVCCFILVFTLTSCVRFIDSRKELVEKFDVDPAAQRTGIQGFYQYEQEQRKRLEALVNQRRQSAFANPNALYQIGAGDTVSIAVKNFKDVSRDYVVRPDGTVRIPFVGKLKLANLSETQAIDLLESKLTDYVVDPQVDVQVTTYSANVVWLVNSNKNSGNTNQGNSKNRNAYPLKNNNYSLVDLLLEAGDNNFFNNGVLYFYPAPEDRQSLDEQTDLVERFNSFNVSDWVGKSFEDMDCDGREFSPDEDKKEIRVKACYPFENKITQAQLDAKYDRNARIEIDIEEVFGGLNRAPINLILKPGDVIYMPPPATIQIFGEVRRRGTFQVVGGSSSGSTGGGGNGIKPTLLSALSAAKGLSFSADINNLYIYRELHFANKSIINIDLEKIVLLAGQDVRLRDGDIVYVPSKENRYAEQRTVGVLNGIAGAFTSVDSAIDVTQ